jgi:hypothetical protein
MRGALIIVAVTVGGVVDMRLLLAVITAAVLAGIGVLWRWGW